VRDVERGLRVSYRIAQVTELARSLLRRPPHGEMQTYARLARKLRWMPRYTPGFYRFPFGEVRYADSASLLSQYFEIFVLRRYDIGPRQWPLRILDCGGNIGLSVLWFKQRYPESHVTVFEADPVIARILWHNTQTWDLCDVNLVEAAAWSSETSLSFARDGADSGRVEAAGKDQVQAVRLANYLETQVDLLKLDIEGAEYEVLLDLCESGKIDMVRHIICEVHGDATTTHRLAAILHALGEHGFCCTIATARSAPDLPGPSQATPFPALPDARYLLHLYAWRPVSNPLLRPPSSDL
jgi:FkbM family methyltransferase